MKMHVIFNDMHLVLVKVNYQSSHYSQEQHMFPLETLLNSSKHSISKKVMWEVIVSLENCGLIFPCSKVSTATGVHY